MAEQNNKDEQGKTPHAGRPVMDEAAENWGEPEELDGQGMPLSDEPVSSASDSALEASEERYRRLMADYDNYRRRTAKEALQQQQKGRRDAASRLLPVIDSLSMALLSVPADNPARTGIDAVMRQAIACFEDLGIQKIPTRGEPFNPELHEAIGHLPSAEFPEGIICQESRAGFSDSLGLLRPAQVLVSSGNG